MSRLKDLTGKRFGKLVVIQRAENDKQGRAQWICKCDCGTVKRVRSQDLITGRAPSCGCKTHTPRLSSNDRRLLRILKGMRQRCNNPSNPLYKYYGARGITVCSEWEHVDKFREWAYANGYKDNLTIERIDVNGNYEPSNCTWVTQHQQASNKRNNTLLTLNGETHTMAEWGKITGIDPRLIRVRIKKLGWSVEQALTESTEGYHRKKN